MSRLIVSSIGMSIDGFAAGPRQSIDHPLGQGGLRLMEWALATRTLHKRLGIDTGGAEETGIDDEHAVRGFDNIGAWIIGRNMFGPVRGPWPDDTWKGWWGEEPPYHVPVFVLTHHARAALQMKGGTTFHFVTEGIQPAYEQAKAAAAGRNVRVGGGSATIRQFLQARLVDEMHLAVSPVLLGQGEPLLAGLDLPALGYECTSHTSSARVMHVVISKTS